jgi:hypothetical protein
MRDRRAIADQLEAFVRKAGTPNEHGILTVVLGAKGPGETHTRPPSISKHNYKVFEKDVLSSICDTLDEAYVSTHATSALVQEYRHTPSVAPKYRPDSGVKNLKLSLNPAQPIVIGNEGDMKVLSDYPTADYDGDSEHCTYYAVGETCLSTGCSLADGRTQVLAANVPHSITISHPHKGCVVSVCSTHDPKWHSASGCSACHIEPTDGDMYDTCGRCMTARYCSKECQVSAWKAHKKVCKRGCAQCHQQPDGGTKLSACNRCKSVKYCSKECQVIHWEAGHKKECVNTVLPM